MKALVLAGERPGGSALARTEGVAAGVLVDVAGLPCVARVLTALRQSHSVNGGLLIGPDASIHDNNPVLQQLLADGVFRWIQPDAGPSASARAGASEAGDFPLLLTAGDHALLSPETIDAFCAAAADQDADFVVGLVAARQVAARWPAMRRTRLRFADGTWCGSNLFLLRRPGALRVLDLWSRLEASRKKPWRLAMGLGPGLLTRYALGRLTLDDALSAISRAAGAAVAAVEVSDPLAAVDVDSAEDLAVARAILEHG